MTDMIGCCGVNCTQCSAYIATQTDDNAKREEIAREWTAKYNTPFSAEQINCDGCQANGRANDWTAKICPTRKCCRDKGIENCAACDQYPCEHPESVFKFDPKARATLDALRD